MAAIEIQQADWVSRARLKCIQQHTDWRARETGFYCYTCGEEYDVLVDGKSGRFVDRDDVEVR